MIIITEKEVQQSINKESAFKAIEESYRLYSAGETTTPQTISMPVNNGTFYSFPAYLHTKSIFISKQASDFRQNPLKGLPTVHPYILVFDSQTGVLTAMIEGRYFASVRTALSSAVGIKYLARSHKRIAILGSGVQAKAHARTLVQLFPNIEEVRMFSPTRSHLLAAVDELRLEQMPITACQTAHEAVRAVDVIVTATSSSIPVFDNADVGENTLIVGVGAMKSDREIPLQTVARARLVVDSRSNVSLYDELRERVKNDGTGDILELGEVIAGAPSPAQGVRLFKHHGLPVTDAALAQTLI